MDHVQLWPVAQLHPAHKLASPETADSDDEGGMMDLLTKSDGRGIVELIRPVRGEAILRAADDMGEQRDRRGVATEMGVQMLDAIQPAPVRDDGPLHEIGEMADQTPI